MRATSSTAASIDAGAPSLIGERYRVEAALGRGGAAQLFRVVDLAQGRTVALKQLHAKVHPKLRELFELEYQTLASLEHPRTPRAFEFGSDARGPFYTMELLEGRDLSSDVPLPWQVVCDHLRDACLALGVLHARKLVHRDVSARNLWRTPDGRVKLIDFGALAPFGPNAQLIGTPPHVPPEALASRALDQRADLYALGAVAYFLLTGRHAYPARALDQLPELWREPPAPPSHCVAQLARPDLAPIPPELDALVLALLSHNELARPSATAEVIDRIDALRGVARESEGEAAQARLTNVAYVGRTRERRQLARRLALARGGRGQSCVIESPPGGGRSRAIKELSLAVRVSNACVVHVNASADSNLYGVASALALALLDALPERARSAAEPYAPLLAHLSPRVRERLGVEPEPQPEAAGELRVRIQEAERDWFLAIAREWPVLILVDGLEHADDGSAAFLLALALALPRAQLLLVCALVTDRPSKRSAAVRALLRTSRSIRLGPLSAADLQALLQSVFGAAEHLDRLSGRLHELTRGNPGHALEVCRQLVERGAIAYESGNWVLPQELDTRSLAASREQALLARLSHLTPAAKELARLLSLHAGALSPGLCRALATCQGRDLLPQLGELMSAEVLVSNGESVQFAHEEIRTTCLNELPPEAALAARRVLADQLLSAPEADSLQRLQAGLHLTEAGDDRGPGLVVRACLQLYLHEIDKLVPAAPMIERALICFRARQRSAYDQATLLAALMMAGYEGERRYVSQYGEAAVQTLEHLLCLPLARRLRRYLGGRLALGVALAWAATGFLRRHRDPCVPGFVEALHMLVGSAAAAAGASSICFDALAAARLAHVLQPFSALGPNHIGAFMYDFCVTVAETVRDTMHATHARWQSLLARAANPKLLAQVSDAEAKRARGGALFGAACLQSLRDGPDALRAAEELERNGLQLDRVYADQVRTIYYGCRGDVAAYDHYRQRAEQHAIARGTTWQIEIWMPGPTSVIALHLRDGLAMKSASEQMRRLGEQIPSVEVHARFLRGIYLLMRERYAEAVERLAGCLQEAPRARTAWARQHGVLARAYNRLGEHAQAHAACMRVFEHFDERDFDYVHVNMIVQTERVIAEAGLGRSAEARAQLAQLHERHSASDNPLLRGQLFETSLELALMEGDLNEARRVLIEIEALYRPLRVPSLAQYCARLAARIEQCGGVPYTPGNLLIRAAANANSAQAWSMNTLPAGRPLPEQAQNALRALAAATYAEGGALYVVEPSSGTRLIATTSGEPPSELVQRWVAERLTHQLEDVRTQVESEVDETNIAPWDILREGEQQHRVLALTTTDGSVVGMAVLNRAGDPPTACPSAILHAVAQRLAEVLRDDQTERSLNTFDGQSR